MSGHTNSGRIATDDPLEPWDYFDYTFPWGSTHRYVLQPHDRTLVAVSPEVARLIEAVGADNLPALLRVALVEHESDDVEFAWEGVQNAHNAVPRATWERLGEALDGDA